MRVHPGFKAAATGSTNALKASIPATTWRKLLLWTALLSGVLLLVRMAWQLGQELKLGPAQKNAAQAATPVVEEGGGDGP